MYHMHPYGIFTTIIVRPPFFQAKMVNGLRNPQAHGVQLVVRIWVSAGPLNEGRILP